MKTPSKKKLAAGAVLGALLAILIGSRGRGLC